MNKPRAFTLVEMIAVMSVGSVLLVLAVSLVHRSMRLDSQWREEADTHRALSRFSHDLRSDVHRATSVEVSQDPFELIIKLDAGTVNYSVNDREIIRGLTSSSGLQREFYKKPQSYQVSVEELASSGRLKLQITRDTHLKGVAPRVAMNMEAEVGRLLRMTAVSEVSP